MAAPRDVREGKRYLVTRRCARRRFRLRPSALTNEIFWACVALAAARSGVLVHALVVMSNHYHLVVTDAEGRLPVFTRELNRAVAKCMNALQGEWEALWSLERCHCLELGDEEDVIARVAYVATNPVEAGLVASPEEWPGVMALPEAADRVVRVRRPRVYFAQRTEGARVPEELTLRLAALPFERATERVSGVVAERVARARARMRALRLPFLGRAGVLARSFVERARSYERRGKLVPMVAAHDPQVRRELLRTQREFRRGYRASRERWCEGDREVVFPWGTWWMRVFHGARVAMPAPS
jgi:REP element-mobilizing transposase RayT